MLTLGTSLTAALKTRATEACYLLNLYFNDDDAVTPVRLSDVTRKVGGNTYIGLVRSWGSLQQEADLIEFSASMGKITIILDNTEHALLDGRFSDLRLTKNFANRKWEIYLSDSAQISTDPIGSGIISADIKADEKQITIHLLNNESKFDKEIPASKVTKANFPYAPIDNIDKPIPMSWGDFSRLSTDTTTYLCRALVKGRFPAIITHETNIDAKCDSVIMNDLQATNLYMYMSGYFAACDENNVTATASPGTPSTGYNFRFGGNVWYLWLPITRDNDINDEGTDIYKLYDEDVATSGRLASDDDPAAGMLAAYTFELRPIAEAGTFTAIKLGVDKSAISGLTGDIFAYYKAYTGGNYGAFLDLVWDTVDKFLTVPVDGTDKFPQEGALLKLTVKDSLETNPHYIDINEISLQIQVNPTESFAKKQYIYESRKKLKTTTYKVPNWLLPGYTTKPWKYYVTEKILVNKDIAYPSNIEYVYCSGQGRRYGAWVDADSRNNGYNEDDLISNPIYIVEHALRTEGGKTTANIDKISFDAAGNTTNGFIGDVFNDTVAGILFAFSQYKFIDMMSFCEKVGHQCGALFFISGNSKMKVAVRRRPADYSANDENMKVDYDKIKIISWNETPINQVRNDITVKYAYDYAREETTESVNPAGDGTSQGDTLAGYNQTLYLEEIMDCCLNALTADDYADALLAWHKDRHNTLIFESNNPGYQALEIGDVIIFKNWPSTLKINGTALATTDFFMITDITKSGPFKVRISCMEVS